MFADRGDAGRRLAHRLRNTPIGRRAEDVVVLGLPRGGVPVAAAVAAALSAPLDVIVVRKIGVPGRSELAMGAIGEDGVRIVNDDVVRRAGVDPAAYERIEARERDELARRIMRFRGGHRRIPITGRTVLVVDDGIATGSTVLAACRVARAHGAGRVIVAAPVAPRGADQALRAAADEVIILACPAPFAAIGQFYDDFSQTTDDEVVNLLNAAPRSPTTTR